ncbi:MAG: hypothetical protein CM15mP49_00370 [Actinomycetota bacterium]|nr:MAG: hypothetical protein CM15mP49_00370 [Actinomycetota bacterium]
MPDPDLVIRTSGEQRLSNFLLWQSAYSEFLFLKEMWPDFNKKTSIERLENIKQRSKIRRSMTKYHRTEGIVLEHTN